MRGVIEEIKIDLDGIFDRHEIAPLFAIGIAGGTLNQAHLAVGTILIEKMIRHRGHATLVLFTFAIDVEVTQTNHLCGAFTPVAAQILIEQKL